MRADVGLKSKLKTLKIGVLAFCEDTNQLYIGSKVGNLPILLANPPSTGSGTPLNVKTPDFIGQTYVDTTAKEAYIANGLTSADWQSISMDELGSASSGAADWNTLLNKPTLSAVATSGSYSDLTNKPALATIATTGSYTDLTNRPIGITATSSDMTYYVDGASGSDTNDGLTSVTAFKTIQKALDTIPKIVNHSITVQLASNTYDGLHTVSGFMGGGSITVKGASTKAEAANYVVKGTLLFLNSTCKVVATGVKTMPSTYTNTKLALLMADGCLNAVFINCLVDGTKGTFTGNGINALYVQRGMAYIADCDVSNVTATNYPNQAYALCGGINAIVNSQNNAGSNNAYGLVAINGATITKSGTQPSGTTNELANGGGVIR